MKILPSWVREFADIPDDDFGLRDKLTEVGLAVEYFYVVDIESTPQKIAFEMEIGTNRPDAMNHYGVAREAAAIYDVPLKSIVPKLPKCPQGLAFPIEIHEVSLCPRFSARIIRGTEINQSEPSVTHRLQLLDQRPISNAVDATNYVLWEMGKPTHVFDMDLLEGGRLIIRRAKNGEKLKTLDGVERKLTSEDLVVADAKRPVGLAGVMGGFDTMITDKTRNILIESAWWDPAIVRQMSRRHGLHTDASHRFERGADFESTILSCDLVAALILESGGGELAGDVIDVVSRQLDQAPVVLRVSEVRRILGGSMTGGHIFSILKRLGFVLIPEGQADGEFRVQIPSWRLDVEREIDVIEEIARLHGYDKFENTLPAYSGAAVELPNAAVERAFRERALALAYNEAVSLTFISHADAEQFSSGAGVLELENPLSEEASVMRTSLAPGMLDMLAWNLNRDAKAVRLFEMGRVYEMRDGERVEPARACLGATLAAVKRSLPMGGVLDVSKDEHGAAAEAFRGFKGDVENLLRAFDGDELSFDRETAEYFHPVRSARALMDGVVVAQFGQTNPNLTERHFEERLVRVILRCTAGDCPGRFDDLTMSACPICGRTLEKSPQRKQVLVPARLPQDVFLAEIDVERLLARGLRAVRFVAIGKYPTVERDFSFVFSDEVEFAAMRAAVTGLRIAELRAFEPVEIFRGGSIGTGKYSVLLRALLQSDAGTLRDEQIAMWSSEIVAVLQRLGGMQRA